METKCIYLNLQVNLIHHFYKKLKKGKLKFHNFKEILFGQFLILPN